MALTLYGQKTLEHALFFFEDLLEIRTSVGLTTVPVVDTVGSKIVVFSETRTDSFYVNCQHFTDYVTVRINFILSNVSFRSTVLRSLAAQI